MRLLPLLATCLLLTASLAAEETVLIAGLRVTGPGQGEGMDGLRAFNQSEGTTIALLVLRKEGGIIDVDEDACTLETVVDSKDKDLTKPRASKIGEFSFNNTASFGSWPKVADDGSAALVEVEVPQRPSPGADSIGIMAQVQITCGADLTEVTAAGVALKATGTTIKAGPFTFTVEGVEAEDWGEWKHSVSLQTTDDYKTIKSIVFKSGGEVLKSDTGGTSTMSSGDKSTTTVTHRLMAIPDQVDVVITYYAKVEKIMVPVKIAAGLDLNLKK